MLVFRWNEWNVAHIARHGIRADEAEYVVRQARPPFPEKRADGKFRVWGRTRGGRYLQVIYVHDVPESTRAHDEQAVEQLSLSDLIDVSRGGLVVFVIHSRELEPQEKKQYLKRTRGRGR